MSGTAPHDGTDDRAPAPQRALVLVDQSMAGAAATRPLADFVTQLIACRQGLPAYRRARQAAPREATRAYGPAPAMRKTGTVDVSF